MEAARLGAAGEDAAQLMKFLSGVSAQFDDADGEISGQLAQLQQARATAILPPPHAALRTPMVCAAICEAADGSDATMTPRLGRGGVTLLDCVAATGADGARRSGSPATEQG